VLGTTCISGLATGVITVPVQCAAAGQDGSPPPLTVAEFNAVVPAASAPTLTGTVMTTVPVWLVSIVQPVKIEPFAGQPVKILGAAATVGAALKVIPSGILSVIVIGAVVGPFAILMVIV
jgi:hypothetical protein